MERGKVGEEYFKEPCSTPELSPYKDPYDNKHTGYTVWVYDFIMLSYIIFCNIC